LFSRLTETPKLKGIDFPVLIPNLKGLEKALKVKADFFSLLTATSETFSQRNINADISESIQRISRIMERLGPSSKSRLRVYISTVFGCPYEGKMERPYQLMNVLEKLLDIGVKEVALGDTIGVANPKQVDLFLREVSKVMDLSYVALHFHDTWSLALPNILAGLERGVRIYDASAAGLGGCPYADGATGNVATEDVVYLMHSLGLKTGIDLELLAHASSFILEKVGSSGHSKVYQALQNKNR
ncbi:MAG: hydroxymethylglutaryl-CoA lyase, partial [Bacteriovoracales bacterium]|nr:hydroxymethylglutaryl-CoA lyase [Bacteriovoracales bacterium]